MDEWIHFLAPSGAVIGMTLPLHSTIEQQWEHGDLQRVNEDGSPWAETVDEAEPEDDAAASEAPARPRPAAKVADWQAYAAAIGACSEDEAAGMTKQQLVELTTPPEMVPPVPEV